MSDFAIAVKAIIIKNEKVLLLKRRSDDAHKPGSWDIPGGRLDKGEDALKGLQREVKEEVNLDCEVVMPVHVQSFIRDDSQRITMLIFVCHPLSEDIVLSEEHDEYKWTDISDINNFPDWVKPAIENILRYKLYQKRG